jgi:hypothetical protein
MQTLNLSLALSAGLALLTVDTDGATHTVTSCMTTQGEDLATRPEDLDRIEAAVEAALAAQPSTYPVVAVEALDVMTGENVWFTVEHVLGAVHVVHYADGLTVSPGTEQFTETTEAFYFDLGAERIAARMDEEDDARHDAFARF